ncbi:hypothetical protein EON65_27105 [archaeon]|nr:MAG: hypothetical protein EON65_27105 [archaeon]
MDLNFDSFTFDEASEIDSAAASMTAMLLQETFATLSLTDKCALSLTLGQIANNTASSEAPPPSAPPQISHIGKIRQTSVRNMDTIMEDGVSVLQDICGDPLPPITDSARRHSFNVGEDMTDIQSVLSETDKESLDAAMSMMGHTELQQVEEEVRKIQNNVRGWLLRKNYTNLRDATKILQSAWRERKKTIHRPSPPGSRRDRALEVPSPAFTPPSSPPPSFSHLNHTATMTPNSVHKSLASLVIQKNLVRWWTQSRTSIFHDLDRSNIARTMTPNLHSPTASQQVQDVLEGKQPGGEFK